MANWFARETRESDLQAARLLVRSPEWLHAQQLLGSHVARQCADRLHIAYQNLARLPNELSDMILEYAYPKSNTEPVYLNACAVGLLAHQYTIAPAPGSVCTIPSLSRARTNDKNIVGTMYMRVLQWYLRYNRFVIAASYLEVFMDQVTSAGSILDLVHDLCVMVWFTIPNGITLEGYVQEQIAMLRHLRGRRSRDSAVDVYFRCLLDRDYPEEPYNPARPANIFDMQLHGRSNEEWMRFQRVLEREAHSILGWDFEDILVRFYFPGSARSIEMRPRGG